MSKFILKNTKDKKGNYFYLVKDHWDDYFRYETTFALFYKDSSDSRLIGRVKIGGKYKERKQGEKKYTTLPKVIDELSNEYFSVGQDSTYYENIKEFGDTTRNLILETLRDMAFDESIYERFKGLHVMRQSLLRSVSVNTLKNQYRRIAKGEAKLTPFQFVYKSISKESTNFELEFNVSPHSNPPTNIHVLIGRNGVGKTHLLKGMIRTIYNPDDKDPVGLFETPGTQIENLFAGVVFVSFSAFDSNYQPPSHNLINYSYVGLFKEMDGNHGQPKNNSELTEEFLNSIKTVFSSRRDLWEDIISVLESDPVFKAIEINKLVYSKSLGEVGEIFKNLSSGHKIVLLTITKLVEVVEEKTLVLLDEPESHLHPPLLSAFTRALSQLLLYRNGIALISTHSPVILQEVPKSCVSILHRNNRVAHISKPDSETFGENVGVLTRDVFGLEVSQSGFHKLLKSEIDKYETYEDVLEAYNYELGNEAKAIARILVREKQDEINETTE